MERFGFFLRQSRRSGGWATWLFWYLVAAFLHGCLAFAVFRTAAAFIDQF